MKTDPSRKHACFVLVAGAGFTPKSDYALDQAAQIASRIPYCELHVVRAIASSVPPSRVEQIANRLEAYMTEVTDAVGAPLEHFAVHVCAGPPSPTASCPVLIAGPKPEDAHVPSTIIEPTCEKCLRVRAETKGAEWWCSQHAAHHPHAHAYRYRRELPLQLHDSAISPTGVDMLDGRRV